MKNRTSRRGCAIATVTVLASCLACQHGTSKSEHGPQPSAPLASATVSWVVGKSYVYSTSLASHVDFSGKGSFDLNLEATLRATPVKVDAGKTEIVVELGGTRLLAGGQADEATKPLALELEKPWVLGLEDGHAAYERFANGLSGQAGGILRTLAGALQFPKGAVGGAKVTTHEFDSTGEYEAEYQSLGGAIQKRKIRYLGLQAVGVLEPARRAAMVPEVTNSHATLRIHDGSLAELSSTEQLKSKLADTAFVLSDTTLALRLTGTEPARMDREALAVQGATVPAGSQYGVAPSRDRFDDLRIGNLTLQQALSQFEAARQVPSQADDRDSQDAKAEETENDKLSAFSALVALVRRDAPARNAVVARANRTADREQKDFFDVLAAAGTPEAQRALASFITAKGKPSRVRESAAMSLIRVREATPETVALLERLVHDPELRQFGVFGLGTAARRLREAGRTEESKTIGAELGALLASAPGNDAQVEALRGIANSADDALLGNVRPFLAESHPPSVREAALEAISRMNAGETETLIADRLANDPASDVRRTAASVAGGRSASVTLINVLTRASTSDQDRAVRYSSVQTLSRWLRDRPELRTVLEAIAKDEREPKIQALARAAVASRADSATPRPM